MSSVDPAFNAEKMLLAQQEFLREEADAERLRLMQQGLLSERKKEDLQQEEYGWSEPGETKGSG